jgi:hypothetical protein
MWSVWDCKGSVSLHKPGEPFPSSVSFCKTINHSLTKQSSSHIMWNTIHLAYHDHSILHPTHNTAFAKKKKPPWPLVRERTIPTDRPPLVDEI